MTKLLEGRIATEVAIERLESACGPICKNCGLPIEELMDPWGRMHGWHHTTIEKEVNVDGVDVMVAVTFCPNGLGEATPAELCHV